MSYRGRQVVRAIDRGELEVAYWLRYARKLTRDERSRIGAGDYRAIARPLEPAWREGDWIDVSPKLTIQLGAITFRRDRYRTRIAAVRDFRGGGRALDRRTHEDPGNMTTIVPINDWPADPPEPEKITASRVAVLPSTVAGQARYEREVAERRLGHTQLPIALRLAHLQRLAKDNHVDISAEERVIERRIAVLEARLLRGEAA